MECFPGGPDEFVTRRWEWRFMKAITLWAEAQEGLQLQPCRF